MSEGIDHRAELLRTQTVTNILGALNAGAVNIYGTAPAEWTGTILESDHEIVQVTHWLDHQGRRWRYAARVTIQVDVELLEGS